MNHEAIAPGIQLGSFEFELASPVLKMGRRQIELSWRFHDARDEAGRAMLCAQLTGPPRTGGEMFEHWQLELPITGLQCDHVLVQGDSMGGCVSLAASPEVREFHGAGMLLLRRGDDYLQLEFPAANPGETGWSGRFAHGKPLQLQGVVTERFAANAEFPAVALEIRTASNAQVLLEGWAKRHAGSRRQSLHPTAGYAGWNSWDYYRWTVTADDVLANAEFIANDPALARRVRRIVIDDGWMHCYGEWEPNSRFGDMGKLARELRKMGFVPGLWFAPGVAEPQSMIAQRHWEYLARGAGGWPCLAFECMTRQGFLLDPTRAEVRRWLFDLFRRYRELGFGYFKLDFLKQTLNARQFSDRTASASDIMRCLLQPISEAAGVEAELLGCNYPFASGSDFIDIVRIGSDIHAQFDTVRRNSVSVAARMSLHNIRWRNDPDFAVIRGPETSDDPEIRLLRPCQVYVKAEAAGAFEAQCGGETLAGDMSIAQAQTMLGLILLSGGELNFSDCMPRLNARGLALIDKIAAAPVGAPGYAEDLMRHELPERYVQFVAPTHVRRLLINWSAEARAVHLPPPPSGRFEALPADFWSGETVYGNTITLPPGSSRLLEYAGY